MFNSRLLESNNICSDIPNRFSILATLTDNVMNSPTEILDGEADNEILGIGGGEFWPLLSHPR